MGLLEMASCRADLFGVVILITLVEFVVSNKIVMNTSLVIPCP